MVELELTDTEAKALMYFLLESGELSLSKDLRAIFEALAELEMSEQTMKYLIMNA